MRPLSPFSELKLYQLIHLLDDFILVAKSVASNLPTGPFKEPLFIRISLFHRYVNRIEFLIPLLRRWEHDEKLEDPIGLIIRACLADVLSQFYLEEIHSKVKSTPSEEENEYLRVCSDFLADHLFSGVNYFKVLKEGGVFKNEFYQKSIDDWVRLYPGYFKAEPINYDKPAKNISARQFPTLLQILRDSRNNELFKSRDFDQIYMSYFFYSKYEHFGITTDSLQSMDMNLLLYFMMDPISYVLLACLVSCGHFEHTFKCYTIEREKIFER